MRQAIHADINYNRYRTGNTKSSVYLLYKWDINHKSTVKRFVRQKKVTQSNALVCGVCIHPQFVRVPSFF